MKKDFHMHTYLSDGSPSPVELVRACMELKLDEISITDHDSIGAYPEVLEVARGSSLKVTPGAELDCTYGNLEIHMLGLNLDTQNEALNHHLSGIQAARKKRAQEQADAINRHYRRTIVDLEKICSHCQTFMNPHLIHAMIDEGLFDEFHPADRYKRAQQWMKQNIQVDSVIEKPTAETMLKMIHKSGGIGVLAHPGYYLKDGLDVRQMISDLKEMGMDGLEVTYPYFQEASREFPSLQHEREAIEILHELASQFELLETTGSDAHEIRQLVSWHSRS
ncbi:PHP domain-containing protein [bacterium]|nr:PHP domain-containing protein [bacterium]MCI0602404.1 PHP domain-containing protein [bacterium]